MACFDSSIGGSRCIELIASQTGKEIEITYTEYLQLVEQYQTIWLCGTYWVDRYMITWEYQFICGPFDDLIAKIQNKDLDRVYITPSAISSSGSGVTASAQVYYTKATQKVKFGCTYSGGSTSNFNIYLYGERM